MDRPIIDEEATTISELVWQTEPWNCEIVGVNIMMLVAEVSYLPRLLILWSAILCCWDKITITQYESSALH